MKFQESRIEKIITEAAAKYISKEASRESLITVTRVLPSKDFKDMDIFVTVLPEVLEKKVMSYLKRHRSDFKEFVRQTTALRRIPFFEFKVDGGEKSRQRIEEISRGIK
jgi:ribosome-binding factor A